MASSEKRCLYEVLGVNRDCTPDEIRSAYRRLALQRHPDKLVKSGVSESEATAAFQELVNAYEVLSDARERAWYDSHRSQILFSSNSGPTNSSNSGSVPDLFSFFSNSVYSGYSDKGKGFYKVYGDLFEKIYQNDLNFARTLGVGLPKEAPLMGNLDSPYAQVTAFYNYWLGFVTVMDFCWVDQYDVMAGPNRKSRRVMEEENKKLRKKARREYNETVRGLAEFVKKRDKRVIDMQMKRNEEMERKREKERERKKELEREKAEKAKKYVEPDWAKAEELENEEIEEDWDEDGKKKADENELYCVVCSKKFKSEKQWKNHEQSKKHKEKVAALREAFDDEDDEYEGLVEDGVSEEQKVADGDITADLSADDGVDELAEQFEGSTRIQEDECEDDEVQSSNEDETTSKGLDDGFNYRSGSDSKGVVDEPGLDDDEASLLEAMVSGRKSRKNAGPGGSRQASAKNVQAESSNNEMDFMEYNNLRSTRRNKGGRRQRNRRPQEEEDDEGGGGDVTSCATKVGIDTELDSAYNDNSAFQGLSSDSPPETANDRKESDLSRNSEKVSSQGMDKKTTVRKEKNTKSKDATKGRKQKGTSKFSGNSCETCGEEFDTRNQLHKHLGATGHAKLKSR
ncbi:PREDICTED: DNAJ protein JJJ1 homolog isoform X2 [Nicotiana attenuata]|uniref:DNAJ protein JJJ1 homolog isoform X2 n=1 Tax=Nicotiana attenuata TaxID=49451 RepID=UPI000904623F|nr:PREDICTED: DNAJ protein JJJ1 homolog isoform X2 [Nicotiana attenuata]